MTDVSVPVSGPMARRRILFVIDKLAQRSGGAERVMIETANALAGRGHMVEIVSYEFRGRPPFYPLAPGVIHSNLRPRRRGLRRLTGQLRHIYQEIAPEIFPFDRLTWLSRNGGFWRRLEAHLAATRPDVAVAFMPPSLTALGLARPPEGTRRMVSLHNVPEQDFDNPLRWDPLAYDRALRRAALDRMERITILLPEFRAWFPEAMHSRLTIMPNAIQPLEPGVLAAAVRAPVVLAVGRLADVKRHDLLLDAWAAIADRFPDWRLEIFGEGPRREALEARIARLGIGKSARLMGHVPDIREKHLTASVLAHPAEFEGFGLAPAEALAAGLPVVGFADCSGVNQLVRDEVNGILVPGAADHAARVAGFAQALSGLMADPEARTRLGAAGPASMAIYAPDRVIDRWEEMILGGARPTGG